MNYTSVSGAQNFGQTNTYPELSLSSTPNANLRSHFLEYVRMVALFTRLYYENRLIAIQNFILSCKLQGWALVFLSYKVQIFFTRLAYGRPVSECWPKG